MALVVATVVALVAASCSSAGELSSTSDTTSSQSETTLSSGEPDVVEAEPDQLDADDGDTATDTDSDTADDITDNDTQPDEADDDGSSGLEGDPTTAGVIADPDLLPPVLETVPDSIQWEQCGSIECATVKVPLDHREPDGELIDLSVARKAATGASRGAIFVNFGGPGGETVSRIATFNLPGDLGDSYDLIGWDPRGTGGTEPLNCGNVLPDEPTTLPDTTDGFDDELAAAFETFDVAVGCAAQNPISQHIGTIQVAYDLDHLRRALGNEQLDYLGYSYGTQIGWVYASLFPDRVGHFVLDGGVLPGTFTPISELDRYPVFDQAFERLDQGCDAVSDCPLNDEGMVETVERLYGELEANPLPAGNGGTFGPADLASVVVTSTYFPPDQGGPLVANLIDQVDDGDTGPAENFLQLVSSGVDPAVFWSVICADGLGVSSEEEALVGLEALTLSAPLTVGVSADLAYCDRIDAEVIGLPELDTTGAAPILVIGNTGDPATPYAWSVGLAERLNDGHLLTYHGGGHTIAGSNECVDFAVERYFLDDVLPPEGTQCGPRPSLLGIVPDEADTGILVNDVLPGSGADEAGLERGDVIESINGEPLSLLSTLPSLPPDEPALLVVARGEDTFEVELVPQLAEIDGWYVPILPQPELP